MNLIASLAGEYWREAEPARPHVNTRHGGLGVDTWSPDARKEVEVEERRINDDGREENRDDKGK